MLGTWIIAVGLESIAVAGCEPADLEFEISATETAFRSGDATDTTRALSRMRKSLSCSIEPLSANTCARIHRATALARWLKEDTQGTQLALQAMLHADPLLSLGPELIPTTHPLHYLRISAEEATARWSASLDAPSLVDGVRTGAVPTDQPYVLQSLQGEAVSRTRWVARGNAASLPSLPSLPDHAASSGRAKTHWYSGVGLGAGGVVLYGAALSARSRYNSAVFDQDDAVIGARHLTTNLLSAGAVSAGVLSLASITTSEILRKR